jgi:hypothetical protein
MKRNARIFIRILVATLAVWLCAWVAWKGWARHRLEAAKERVRLSGLPMSIDELRPGAVADSDNAAHLILELGERMSDDAYRKNVVGPSFEDRIQTFRTSPASPQLNPKEADELAALLADPVIARMLKLASQAAARPGYNAQLNYEKGAALIIPTLAPLRHAIVLLSLRARLEASRGRHEETCADIWAMFTIAAFVANEPTLISSLTRIACTSIALESLESAVAEGAVNATWSLRFLDRIATLEYRQAFARALDGERLTMGGDFFDKTISGKTNLEATLAAATDATGKVPGRFIWKIFAADLFRLEYAEYLDRLRLFREAVSKLSPPYSESLTTLREIAAVPRYHVLVGIVLPTLDSVTGKILASEQKLSAAAAGLALHRFALQRGRAAQSLEELIPDFVGQVPIDRFTARPMLYRSDAENSVVYSVGKNLRDDAGDFIPDAGKDDLSWRMPTTRPIQRSR